MEDLLKLLLEEQKKTNEILEDIRSGLAGAVIEKGQWDWSQAQIEEFEDMIKTTKLPMCRGKPDWVATAKKLGIPREHKERIRMKYDRQYKDKLLDQIGVADPLAKRLKTDGPSQTEPPVDLEAQSFVDPEEDGGPVNE